MGTIKAGNLDRRVAIVRAGPATDDGFTTLPGTLQLVGKRWASIKPARGGEPMEAEQRTGIAEATIWLRWDSLTRTIAATDMIVADGRLFSLVAPPREIGRREGVELFVKAETERPPINPDDLEDWTP